MRRTETVRYSSRYGEVSFQPSALKYMIYVDTGDGYQPFVDYTVSVLCELYVDSYDSTYTRWTGAGSSPYLNDDNSNYIHDDLLKLASVEV